MTTRLIETWLPIPEIGLEGLRERTPMTPFPEPNRLHVWWSRSPW
jgi:adenine-specific DNA methylase